MNVLGNIAAKWPVPVNLYCRYELRQIAIQTVAVQRRWKRPNS